MLCLGREKYQFPALHYHHSRASLRASTSISGMISPSHHPRQCIVGLFSTHQAHDLSPTMEASAWILQGQNGVDSLNKVHNVKIPALGDHDVLVQLQAASLNHRDLAVAEVRTEYIQESILWIYANILNECIGPSLPDTHQAGNSRLRRRGNRPLYRPKSNHLQTRR